MKKKSTNFTATCLSLLILLSTSVFASGSKVGKAESIVELSVKFEQAIEQRQFGAARSTVEEIIPLMKKDLKTSKKEMASVEDESEKANLQSDLQKKNEIYLTTKKIFDTSAAAIRVKGKDMVKMLNEYVDLIN